MACCRNYCDVKRGNLEAGICTRTFAFCILSKDETTNVGTGALFVLAGSVLHVGSTPRLKIMSLNQICGTFHKSLLTIPVLVSDSMATHDQYL
jgi:hypothetical protein